MKSPISGFQDKLYWRQPFLDAPYHCFKKHGYDGGGYISLCGRARMGPRIGGQSIDRPIPELRCGRCDGLEADRRGWDESGPETIDPAGNPVKKLKGRR